jgi:hypothetical protein
MAIRDRVTVHTRDGRAMYIMVTRQGGKISQKWPRNKADNFEAHLMDKNDHEVGESIIVPLDNVASVVTDSAPRERPPKKRA